MVKEEGRMQNEEMGLSFTIILKPNTPALHYSVRWLVHFLCLFGLKGVSTMRLHDGRQELVNMLRGW